VTDQEFAAHSIQLRLNPALPRPLDLGEQFIEPNETGVDLARLCFLPDSVLIAEKERCNQRPEWLAVFSLLYEGLERQEELERFRQYHRSIAQKGGRAHRSTGQPEIVEACKDMYARNSKVAAKKAYEKLSGKGHKMPDGRVIGFNKEIAFETFRTRYWPKRCTA
jgi:hypothetical protein